MTASNLGIEGMKAPVWDVEEWFNLDNGVSRLDVDDLAGKVVYLYGFQSWCPGCHSHGFPTLAAVQRHFSDNHDVAFVAIQTVFEGFEVNGLTEALASVTSHGLSVPVGHDPGRDGLGSDVMRRYRSGGTPWIVLIDRDGIVRFNGFQADATDLVERMETLLARPRLAVDGADGPM